MTLRLGLRPWIGARVASQHCPILRPGRIHFRRKAFDKVFHSVERAAQWGLAHRDLSNVRSIGVDEVLWQRGHKYLTVVYQIDNECKRLLWVGKDRTIKTLLHFFPAFGKRRSAQLCFICSDMWKPCLKVIAKKASQAIHVLDRFHTAMHMNTLVKFVRRKRGN